ncbi:hypothetical protein JTE90_029658 [Oedothorax gibbosus]|uniref:Uncharacterized protein n=1 Tax=Oedothorax gibbosus TaxID=931172 RepID=A0AAV6VEF7_9ARAC|nr:hypothetical protein JTE90_029658 [Oedothorax gibbosus]
MFLLFLLYHCMKRSFSELYSIKGKVKLTKVVEGTGTTEHFEYATIIVIGWGRNFDGEYFNRAFQHWDILKDRNQDPKDSKARVRNILRGKPIVVELVCVKSGDQPEFKIKEEGDKYEIEEDKRFWMIIDENYHYALEKEAWEILYSEVHSSFKPYDLRNILDDHMKILKKKFKKENIQIKSELFYYSPKQRKERTKKGTSKTIESTPNKQKTLQCSIVSSSADPLPRTTRPRRSRTGKKSKQNPVKSKSKQNPVKSKSKQNPVKSKQKNSHTRSKEDILQPTNQNQSSYQSMDKLHNSMDYCASFNLQSMTNSSFKHSYLTTPVMLRNTVTNFNQNERDTLPVQNYDGYVDQCKMTGFHLQPSCSMNLPNPASIFKYNIKEALSGINFDSYAPGNPFMVNFHPHKTWSSELRNFPSTVANFNQNNKDTISDINFDGYEPYCSFAYLSNRCINNQLNLNMGGTQTGTFQCVTSSESYVSQTQMDDSPDQLYGSPQNNEKTSEAISIEEYESEDIDIDNMPPLNFEGWDKYMGGNGEDLHKVFEAQTSNGASEN